MMQSFYIPASAAYAWLACGWRVRVLPAPHIGWAVASWGWV